MKTINTITITAFAVAALAPAAASASVYQCPNSTIVSEACHQLDGIPLSCFNLSKSGSGCNTLQCNQAYIDNYVACQCRHGSTKLYEYLPSQDTQASSDPAASSDQLDASAASAAAVTDVKAEEEPTTTDVDPNDEPTEAPVPNDSYNSGGIPVGAVVGIILGLMGFLLAATLLTMIIGSRRNSTSNNSSNSGEIPAPEYRETSNGAVYEFAPPMHLTSASTTDDNESIVMWSKIERDLNVNGTLPAYSDIMADGSSFAAMKDISRRNGSSSSTSSNSNSNSIGYNYYARDTHTHRDRSNSPITHSTALAEGDSNADQDSVGNSVGRNTGSRDNAV
ncbi:hypothetical protein BGX26_010801 [Mortierella sp. AD094]|nr:hypothetical protein BGX26_010801 [Mortierella sp. AD094]